MAADETQLEGLDLESRQMVLDTVAQLKKRLLTKDKILEYDREEVFPEDFPVPGGPANRRFLLANLPFSLYTSRLSKNSVAVEWVSFIRATKDRSTASSRSRCSLEDWPRCRKPVNDSLVKLGHLRP